MNDYDIANKTAEWKPIGTTDKRACQATNKKHRSNDYTKSRTRRVAKEQSKQDQDKKDNQTQQQHDCGTADKRLFKAICGTGEKGKNKTTNENTQQTITERGKNGLKSTCNKPQGRQYNPSNKKLRQRYGAKN